MTQKKVDTYISTLPGNRQAPFRQLLETIRANIDPGFKEVCRQSPAFVVPLEAFPAGYHCTPGTPLFYVNLVSGKTAMTLHHFGLYMNPELLRWFIARYTDETGSKPDMGKGCIRFRKPEKIPYELIGELMQRQSMQDFIAGYEQALAGRRKKSSP